MPRQKSFDPAEKLEEAMAVFWLVGFEKSSIPLLEKELGINRFSLYDTFGKKRTLFASALALYRDGLVRELIEPLERGTQGVADLRRFFRRFRRKFTDAAIPGCLLCNTATEVGSRDEEIAGLVHGYFAGLERAIFECLSRARDLGEIEDSTAALRARAAAARAGIQGVLVGLRLSDDREEASRTAKGVEAACTA